VLNCRTRGWLPAGAAPMSISEADGDLSSVLPSNTSPLRSDRHSEGGAMLQILSKVFKGWWGPTTLIAAALVSMGCERHNAIDFSGPTADWPQWGGSPAGLKFSPLTQITGENVGHLQVAWTYRIGMNPHPLPTDLDTFEATPIIAEGRMYLCSGFNRVVALQPQTGEEIWSFDPKIHTEGKYVLNCRGVSYFHDSAAAPDAACAGRILTGTLDGRLIALDARTGRLCAEFGQNGVVNLKDGLGLVKPGEYGVPSPPTIVADRAIVGANVLDNMRVDAPAGVIRAYDVRTGRLSWAWNPLPPGTTDADLAPPGETYARGTTNAWTVFAADVERGLVFVPTGNTSPDHFGGLRHGLDYYSSSIVALNAETGKVVWHFQTVHHDLWDYDLPAQPVLFDFPTDHGMVPALAQATKQGNIFILDRRTGEPLVAVEERPAPQGGGVPEETLAPTQPYPTNAAYAFGPAMLTDTDIWGFTPWDRAKCRDQFHRLENFGPYTPPSVRGSIIFPYPMGVMNWGGIAIDPEHEILVVNTNRVPGAINLIPRDQVATYPWSGLGMHSGFGRAIGAPYASDLRPLLSPLGAPCNAPPWGTLAAIDLRAGKRLWEVPFGTTRDLAPFPLWLHLGVPNLGGPLITASGLVFIAATTDNFIRAFNVSTGSIVWQARLPAGGQATPMTFRLGPDQKQFLVIAAGGSRLLGTKLGDYLVAYSLPD
jgi:quinoprotein glucose dehydrogenase